MKSQEMNLSQKVRVNLEETNISLDSQEFTPKSGVRSSKNPIHKELLHVVFQLQITKRWSNIRISKELGFESKNYLTMLLNNFDKWWPKTLVAQDRILEKIKRGKTLLTEYLSSQQINTENKGYTIPSPPPRETTDSAEGGCSEEVHRSADGLIDSKILEEKA